MEQSEEKSRCIEVLVHFHCSLCDKWWTVGDAPDDKEEWFCAWCGVRQ